MADFDSELADYLEKSEKCRNFWKSAGLLAAWPAMWPGLRKDHGELYREVCDQYKALCEMDGADVDSIPLPPEKEDPFDLA